MCLFLSLFLKPNERKVFEVVSVHKDIIIYLVLVYSFSQFILNKHLLCTRYCCISYNDATIMRKTSMVPTFIELTFKRQEAQIWRTKESGKWHFQCSLEENKRRFTRQNIDERIVTKNSRFHMEWDGILNALELLFCHPYQGVRGWPLVDMTWERLNWQ